MVIKTKTELKNLLQDKSYFRVKGSYIGSTPAPFLLQTARVNSQSLSQSLLVSSRNVPRAPQTPSARETSKFKASRIGDNCENCTTLECEIGKCERH